eukprot:4576119-Prymnesium_polylepis.1
MRGASPVAATRLQGGPGGVPTAWSRHCVAFGAVGKMPRVAVDQNVYLGGRAGPQAPEDRAPCCTWDGAVALFDDCSCFDPARRCAALLASALRQAMTLCEHESMRTVLCVLWLAGDVRSRTERCDCATVRYEAVRLVRWATGRR